MERILVIGSSNTDMVVKTKRFPNPGETILGGNFFMFPGGKGANQAVAAARMGGDIVFICKIGNDIFGEQAIEGFKKEGINTNYIFRDPNETSGVALITVNEDGENEIVVAQGANNTLSAENILHAVKAIESCTILLLQLEIPVTTVMAAAEKASVLGKRVILNPAPATNLPKELFSYLWLITPNETEAEILTGITVKDQVSARQAADALIGFGVQNVIITLGAEGAYFQNKETAYIIPASKVKAVDTTAAGDVFNGSLAVELSTASNWKAAITIACKAASISVTRMGAQASAPYAHELDTLA
jgi:ribokinase